MTPREELTILRRIAELEAKAAGGAVAAPAAPDEEGLGAGRGLLNNFAMGASLGYADEAAGGVSEATGGDYESARRSFADETAQFKDENPWRAGAAEFAGGVTSMIPAARGIGATARALRVPVAGAQSGTLARVASAMGTGGGAGAVAGTGYAEPDERGEGAVGGGLIGMAAGGLIPPALNLSYALARKLAETPAAVGRMFTSAGDFSNRAVQKVAQAMERDETTPQLVGRKLAGLGPEAMPVDAGGENLRQLGKTVAALPGKGKNQLLQKMDSRALRAHVRITKQLLSSMKLGDVDITAAQSKLHEQMRALGPEYTRLFRSVEITASPEMELLFKSPTMRQALGRAKNVMAEEAAEGKAVPGYTMDDIEALNVKKMIQAGGKAPLIAWDAVKRSLDRIISENRDPVTGKLTETGANAARKKSLMMKQLRNLAPPEYGALLDNYAEPKSAESAMALGRKFMRSDAERTAMRLQDMTPIEREFFRLGAARDLVDQVKRVVDTGQSGRRFLRVPGVREKLREVFPDAKEYALFMHRLRKETVFAETRGVVSPRAGSDTAQKLAGIEDLSVPAEAVAPVVSGLLGYKGPLVNYAVRLVSNRFGGAIPEVTRDELAGLLQDPAKFRQIYSALLKQPQFKAPALPPKDFATPQFGALSGMGAEMMTR